MTRTMFEILAEGYVGWDYENDKYQIEGDPVRVQVEASDDKIRVGVMHSSDEESEVAGLYLSPSAARDLIVGLGAAIRDLETG